VKEIRVSFFIRSTTGTNTNEVHCWLRTRERISLVLADTIYFQVLTRRQTNLPLFVSGNPAIHNGPVALRLQVTLSLLFYGDQETNYSI